MEHIAHGITPLPICHISPRHMRIIISIIVLGLLLTGCSQSPTGYNQALLRAEGLVESRPDSALNILDSISKSSLQSESDNALYALLMVQARVKNRIDDGNDSLINAAVDYYAATDDAHRTMLAYYNRGFLQLLTDSLSQAVSSLLTALDLAEETDYNFYASLACRELSLIFRKTGNTAEELSYADKAFDYIQKDGRQPHADWAMIDLAGAYHHIGEYEKSNDIYRQLIDTLKIRPDSTLLCITYRNLSRSLMSEGKISEAMPYLKAICSSGYVKRDDYALLGICLAERGNQSEARRMLELSDSTSSLANWLRYSILIGAGDKTMAFDALSAMLDDNEKDINVMLHQRATFAALQHHEQQKIAAQEEAEVERMRSVIVILISCIIIIVAIAVIIFMHLHQRSINERNERIAQGLQHMLHLRELDQEAARESKKALEVILQKTQHESNDMREEASRLREELEQIQEKVKASNIDSALINQYQQIIYRQAMERYKAIDKICSIRYTLSPDKYTTSSQIAGWLDSLIKDVTKSDRRFVELEDIANMSYGNVMTELRTTMPKLKEDDFRVFLLSLFGLSPAAIAKLMQAESKQLIYARKKRLRNKFIQLNTSESKRFLSLLNGENGK